MKAILNTLVDELGRLKASGVKTVSVSDDSLAALARVVKRKKAKAPAPVSAETNEKPAVPASAPAPALSLPPRLGMPERSEPKPEPVAAKKLPSPTPVELPEGDKEARWKWLLERVTTDPVCLAQLRAGKKAVLGVGSLNAKIMFVGEAPGAEEEIQGEPFVGPAGQLLTKMISATGLKRGDVYIGNIMNWRPQLPVGAGGIQRGNREPTEDEMNYCLPFLRAQIEIVQPEILVGLGATAAKGLLGFSAFKTLGEVRGRWHNYLGKPLMITYHPSYLLRKEAESKASERKAKRAAWEDFMLVMEKAGMPPSDKQRAYFL